MSPTQAAWVRAHAWRECHRREAGEMSALYQRCACQGGRCGYCGMGKHHACTHEHHAPIESPAGYLTDRGGYVKAQVWEAGHRHVWTCTCKRAGHNGQPVQMTLF